eukprot:scaffold289893_cov32-Tisochrysis_lutea.AAC.2
MLSVVVVGVLGVWCESCCGAVDGVALKTQGASRAVARGQLVGRGRVALAWWRFGSVASVMSWSAGATRLAGREEKSGARSMMTPSL